MFRAGYPASKIIFQRFVLFVVMVMSGVYSKADDSLSGHQLSKNELLTYVAGVDREALYTLLDLDSWCEGAFSSSQLLSVYKGEEFRKLSDLRDSQDTGKYYDFIFEYQCPDSDAAMTQMAASD